MLNKIVDRVIMGKLAQRAIVIVRKHAKEAKFEIGKETYSERPFAMPLGAANRITQSKIKQLIKNEDALAPKVFMSATNSLWVIMPGGYKQIRQLAGKQSDKVDMSWSGRMLRNLGVTKPGDMETEIGFSSATEKQKALWHNVLGAGKSKAIHKFMYINKNEENDLAKEATVLIVKSFKKHLDNYLKATNPA